MRPLSIWKLVFPLFASSLGFAVQPDRIVGPIDSSQMVTLPGRVHRNVKPQYDQGRVEASFQLSQVTLLTFPSPSQQKALSLLVAEQQDPSSANYHKWLTPRQYADRFGLSQNDVHRISAWLKSQGLSVVSVARGRNWIVFSGTAAQIESAFRTELHYYNVKGETHFANATPASIPAVLSGIVTGIRGLDDFHPKPRNLRKAAPWVRHARPDYYHSSLVPPDLLAPGDIATIYDLKPLYTLGIDGTGQKLAIVGQTDVYLSDLNNFRTGFGLTPISGCTTNANGVITACNSNSFRYVLDGTDPGVSTSGDLGEADLDLEWSAAAARGAQIIFVNSIDVFTSAYYAIDNDLAPVVSMSYNICEFDEGNSFGADETELTKANSFGITFVNSSGDTGAAECDSPTNSATHNLAVNGLAVTYPASSPEVTGVGGTAIPYPGGFASTYWGTTNSTDGGTALSYNPEIAWNDDVELAAYLGGGNTALSVQESSVGIASSGGGPSNCATQTANFSSCVAGFPQPSWQAVTIPGQPSVRFTPDVSLLASPNFTGYIVCTQLSELGDSGTGSSCGSGGPAGIISALNLANPSVLGGTSTSAPVFAGIVTLLNQYFNGSSSSGLGNINPTLYKLAATPSNNAFHQVTSGTNVVYCVPGTPANMPTSYRCPTAGFFGYSASNYDATTYYNLVTGLGSVDVGNLALAWAASTPFSTTTSLTASPNPAILGSSVTFTATVTTTGPTSPTGAVMFQDGTTQLGSGTLNGAGVALFTTSSLALGTHSITAVYAGDVHNLNSTSAVLTETIQSDWILTVASTNPSSGVAITVSPSDNNGQGNGSTQFTRTYNNGLMVSVGAAANAGGNNFSSWTGCDAVSSTICTLTMDTNRSISANYGGAQPALRFVPVAPCRIADTRKPNGPFGGPAIAAQSARSFAIPNSSCNVPSTAAAYSLNVTAVPDTGSLGYLTIWPSGQAQPFVSTLNSIDGRVKANAAIVPAGTGGAVSVYVTDTTDVVLDINGYFVLAAGNSSALAFFALPPCRVADTRNSSGPLGGPSLVAQRARSFPVLSSNCNIPSTAQAYSLNFTAVLAGPLGYLTTWPTGMPQPLVSTLNALTGAVTANASIVPAGTSGAISAYVTDNTDLVIDINGYFAPSTSGTDLSLYALPPCRVVDTRESTGSFSGQITEEMTASPCGIPPSAQAVVLNATVVPSQTLGYLTLWPSGQSQPLVSTLNASDGKVTSNMAIVPTTSGVIDAYATNPTQLILDTSGYFTSGTAP